MKNLPYEKCLTEGMEKFNFKKISKKRLIKLNNTAVSNYNYELFVKAMRKKFGYRSKIRIILSNRKTKITWGTSTFLESRIDLYRHSVLIFLHELAHLFAYNKNMYIERHGLLFAKTLEKLIEEWTTWQKEL